MKKALITVFVFSWLLLAITAPAAAFAPFLLFIVGAAFLSAFWSVVQALLENDDKRSINPNK